MKTGTHCAWCNGEQEFRPVTIIKDKSTQHICNACNHPMGSAPQAEPSSIGNMMSLVNTYIDPYMDIYSNCNYSMPSDYRNSGGGYRKGSTMGSGGVHRKDGKDLHTGFIKDVVPNRNEPCPCGSGKKYKKCCIGK